MRTGRRSAIPTSIAAVVACAALSLLAPPTARAAGEKWTSKYDESIASGRRSCRFGPTDQSFEVVLVEDLEDRRERVVIVGYDHYPGRKLFLNIGGDRRHSTTEEGFSGTEAAQILKELRSADEAFTEWSLWPTGQLRRGSFKLHDFPRAYARCLAAMGWSIPSDLQEKAAEGRDLHNQRYQWAIDALSERFAVVDVDHDAGGYIRAIRVGFEGSDLREEYPLTKAVKNDFSSGSRPEEFLPEWVEMATKALRFAIDPVAAEDEYRTRHNEQYQWAINELRKHFALVEVEEDEKGYITAIKVGFADSLFREEYPLTKASREKYTGSPPEEFLPQWIEVAAKALRGEL